MKYVWLPCMLVISLFLTSTLVNNGYEPMSIMLISIGVGAALGLISGLLGYRA